MIEYGLTVCPPETERAEARRRCQESFDEFVTKKPELAGRTPTIRKGEWGWYWHVVTP
jgi:hypothetical protein